MIYPVHAHDLIDESVTDDELATMIVVEAIVSNSFENLDFVDSIDRENIFTTVTQWDGYSELCSVVEGQKALLNSVLPDNHATLSELNEAAIADSHALAARVIEQHSQNMSSQKVNKIAAIFACAACFALLGIGIMNFANASAPSHTASKDLTTLSGSSSEDANKSINSTPNDGSDVSESDQGSERCSPR